MRTIKFCIIVVHLGYILEVVINTVIFEDSRTVNFGLFIFRTHSQVSQCFSYVAYVQTYMELIFI